MKKIEIPYLKRHIITVDREQLRFTLHKRRFHLPTAKSVAPPTPTAWDGSKSRTIVYPLLGNDTQGDCYLTSACHAIQTWTGNVSTEAQFNVQAVLDLYHQLSGGDNGLSDNQIFPAWKSGIFGHKILDEMMVDPTNDDAIRMGMYLFGGASWTCALIPAWYANPQPGDVWDAVGTPDPQSGHAMHLSGFDHNYYQDETWGFDPSIRLTPAGLKAADPEVTLQFSLDMFDANGVATHNGMSYDDLASLWVQCGGQALPPSPFPGPVPPNPHVCSVGQHWDDAAQACVPDDPTPPPPPPAPSEVTFARDTTILAGGYTLTPTAHIDEALTKLSDILHALPGLQWTPTHAAVLAGVIPADQLKRIKSGRLPITKIVALIAAIIAFGSQSITPESIQTLIAAVKAILSGS